MTDLKTKTQKDQDVPYIPGMGWRIMDVIDPQNELNHFYDAIEMRDVIEYMKEIDKPNETKSIKKY